MYDLASIIQQNNSGEPNTVVITKATFTSADAERFVAAWKGKRHGAKLPEIGEDYDSAFDEEYVERVEPLQSQIDELRANMHDMAEAAIKSHEFVCTLQDQHSELVNACRLGFRATAKPSFWNKFRIWGRK